MNGSDGTPAVGKAMQLCWERQLMQSALVSFAKCLGVVVACTACSVTLPAQYEPQSMVRLTGTSYIGEFAYQLYVDGKVQSNQIPNTAAGDIYIGTDVAKFVQRATALEMEKSGLTLDENAPRFISGRILNIEMDDLGYSIDWTYTVEYSVVEKSTGNVIFVKEYKSSPRTTGKFGMPSDYTSTLNDIVREPIEMMLRDVKSNNVLYQDTGPRLSTLRPRNMPYVTPLPAARSF